ncbi:MAG TPA: pyruvate, water dikinase regulatory protein [Propionibacteriaceae bacterium]|nr:pyruvate, water dikinase regulatory protein [Propionibacteriaceae bacterium]
MTEALEIHVIADSTGETGARIARVVETQFPDETFQLIRHPRITSLKDLFEIFHALRETPGRRVVLYTLVDQQLRELVRLACDEIPVPHADLLGPAIHAFEQASGRTADEVMRRPVGVEADYFVRISAMEFAIRNDDGAMPEALRECDICLVGASRSGKTPLSIYLGYLGYKVVNVPLVPGIDPPKELFGVDRWRIVGLTIDAERLQAIRNRRVRGLGGFGIKDGYANLASIYAELDEVGRIQRRLGCPIIDTTGLALEEAAVRVIDLVDQRARRVGAHLRIPAGSISMTP